MKTVKAVKKVNKNGTFRFELENGYIIVKSTKRNYNAFGLGYTDFVSGKTGLKVVNKLNKISSTTKGAIRAEELSVNCGYKKERMFLAII